MKTTTQRILLLSIVLITTIGSYAQISRDQATEIILYEILKIKESKLSSDVYCNKTLLKSTEKANIYGGKTIDNPYNESYLYFINDLPFANWEHTCRYIFIDVATGNYKVYNEKMHPISWSIKYDNIAAVERTKPSSFNISGQSTKAVSLAPQNDHLYAVLIVGHEDVHLDKGRFWRDISSIYTTLITVYGYPKQNIFIYYDDGDPAYGKDFDNDGVDEDVYIATRNAIVNKFNDLSNVLTKEDQLFIYVSDHGGTSGTNSSYIYLSNGSFNYFYDHDFALAISQIECAQMITLLGQCYSGGFVNDYMSTGWPNFKCKNRVIHTAANSDEESWHEYNITGGSYDEFLFYWTAAVRGHYPNGLNAWEEGYSTGNFPFTNYDPSHPGDYNPDINGDGIVQMQEAFAYADNMDSWTPNGYFNPQNSFVSVHPMCDEDIDMNGDLFTLHGLAGTLNSNPSGCYNLSRNYMVGRKLVLNGDDLTLSNETRFTLTGNASLHINSDVTISSLGNGMLSLYGDIEASPGASLTLKGSSKLTPFAEVNSKIEFDTEFDNLTIRDARIQMMNSSSELFLNYGIDNVHVDNIWLTTPDGANNEHKGLDIRSSFNVLVEHSSFEYGRYGLYSSRVMNAPNITIDNCVIRYNKYGCRIYNGGVNITGCYIEYNTDKGLYCSSIDKLSYIGSNRIRYQNGLDSYGLYFDGSSSATARLNHNTISNNYYGAIFRGGLTADLECNYIQSNMDYGVYAENNATIYLADAAGITAGGNALNNNKIALKGGGTTQYFNTFYLNNGYNDLRDNGTSGSYCVNGLFGGYSGGNVSANHNIWKDGGGNPVNGTDYSAEGSSTPIILIDFFPESSFSQCGSKNQTINSLSRNYAPINKDNTYRILSTSIGSLPLNVTINTILNTNPALGKVYNEEIQQKLMSEVLLIEFDDLNSSEEWYLEHLYKMFVSSLGNTYSGSQNNKNNDDLSLALTTIRKFQTYATKSEKDENYKISLAIDEAEILWYNRDFDGALFILNTIASLADNSLLCEINHLMCQIEIEKELIDSNYRLDVDKRIAACTECKSNSNLHDNNTNSNKNNSLVGKTEIIISPNPVKNQSLIEVYENAGADLLIYNSTGKLLLKEKVSSNSFTKHVSSSEFKEGIYFVVISGNNNRMFTQKMVIVK